MMTSQNAQVVYLDRSDGSYAPHETRESLKSLERIVQKRAEALSSGAPGYLTAYHQPTVTLSSGYTMPLIGLGTWKSDKGQVYEAVKAALRCGYRHIDCASYYDNEAEVGRALSEIFKEGWVQREEVFLVGKLWNTDHPPDRVAAALRRTLSDLQVSYLDLYMMHWPVAGNRGPEVVPSLSETWGAMEGLVRQGLVKSIGLCNFGPAKLQRIVASASLPVSVLQVEAHPYWRNQDLVDLCKAKNIHMTAYSPLGSPDSAQLLRRKDQGPGAPPSLMDHPAVRAVAGRRGKSAAQVLIRWALHRGTSALPKSVNPQRISDNLHGSLDFELSEEEMAGLSELEPQRRAVDGSFWLSAAGPYKTLDEFWA